MKSMFTFFALVICAGLLTTAIGCGSDSSSGSTKTNEEGKGDDHQDHGHGAGPHGGQIVEVGGGHHAEILGNQNRETVIVFLLNGPATEVVPVADAKVRINLKINGKFEGRDLPAVGVKDGKASKFVIEDHELLHALKHAKENSAKLSIKFDEKSLIGEIPNLEDHDDDHEHEGEEHSHSHDHDGDDIDSDEKD